MISPAEIPATTLSASSKMGKPASREVEIHVAGRLVRRRGQAEDTIERERKREKEGEGRKREREQGRQRHRAREEMRERGERGRASKALSCASESARRSSETGIYTLPKALRSKKFISH